jgi:hypothetical protein
VIVSGNLILMRKALILLTVIIFYFGCHDNKTKSNLAIKPLKLHRIFVDKIEVGPNSNSDSFKIFGFKHYVSVDNYNEDDWNYFIVDCADKYIDTCSINLPIWSITFCKPFNFAPADSSTSLKTLQKHAFVTIGYGYETLHKKFPDISYVQFWNDGKPIHIQTLTVDRAKDKGYYDSAGQYKTDFIKELDKKYHTHFYDSTKK